MGYKKQIIKLMDKNAIECGTDKDTLYVNDVNGVQLEIGIGKDDIRSFAHNLATNTIIIEEYDWETFLINLDTQQVIFYQSMEELIYLNCK
ncbi:hypothetical protein [Clostridium grantii]|uniref:Uncharacterized protein n=1 Tax=Clostridium grantii DSM 8605 TaxID=1121316 RepID=A0A1M5SDL4_9CLOT|nr:hypothetical protein [Clostridium grantii]SHH36551.1 hypothetical protein SAMN02745207_00880 [Clostridium grantii DSM 8605]